MEVSWVVALAIVVGTIVWLVAKLFQRQTTNLDSDTFSVSQREQPGPSASVPREAEIIDPGKLLAQMGITISVETDSCQNPVGESKVLDTGPLQSTPDGGWTLNPKSTFPLTIYGAKQSEATEVKVLLDESCVRLWQELLPKIVQIAARLNFRCKEIDTYIQTSRTLYLRTLQELQASSPDWQSSSSLDRQDLLDGFRLKATEQLRVRPRVNLPLLFEGEPKDATVDDRVIERYGYEAAKAYLGFAEQPERVHSVPTRHYDRTIWEQLVELGLARRGTDIPLPRILEVLTLREMNELAKESSPRAFRRKAEAAVFLLGLPEIEGRLTERIAFRQLFQLNPLPSEFSTVNLGEIRSALEWCSEVCGLLQHTYVMGYFAAQHRARYQQSGLHISRWRISAVGGETACPHCLDQSKQILLGTEPPRVPLHVGCRCQISPLFEDDPTGTTQ